MRILFVDQYSDLGGAQRCLVEVAEAVSQQGWRARAALPDDGPLGRLLRESGIAVTRIRCGPFTSGRKTISDCLRFSAQFPALTSQLKWLLRESPSDLVYVNGARPLPAVCAAARGVSVLFHAHSLLAPKLAWLAARCLRLPGRARVIAGSRFVAAPLARHLPVGMVKVVYNGVPDCSSNLRERPRRGLSIGVIGRISPEKGQLEFIRAARILLARLPDVRFLVAGEPVFSNSEATAYFETLRREARGLPVEFPGWYTYIRRALAELDLLVVPSTGDESTTRVILEAFSAGVPVAAFATGGIPEVLELGRTGFLVEERTPEALANVVFDILTSRSEEARQHARRARVAWEERFTVSRFQREILEIIREV